MRNKFGGQCADCDTVVLAGAGYFERRHGRFVVRCMKCVVEKKVQSGKPLSNDQAIARAALEEGKE